MKKLLLLLILSFFSAQGFAGACPDGSEPVKSISDDGTYYVYNCGITDLTKNQGTWLYCVTIIATVIPERWTCFESPLMDLEIPKDRKLIDDYVRYQEIISLNAAPRLGGFQNNPPKDNCIHMFKNFKEFANSNAGKNYGDLSLFDCLHDLRARL